MKYSTEDYFQQTSDMVVRLLAKSNHRNVAKLFRKTGFTCELETQCGRFFELIALEKKDNTAQINLYWGVSVNDEYRSKVEEYIGKVQNYMNGLCTVDTDDCGRIVSRAEFSCEERHISLEELEKAERYCSDSVMFFRAAISMLNSCGYISENAYYKDMPETYIPAESEGYEK